MRKYERALSNSPRVATGSISAQEQLPPPRLPALKSGVGQSAAASVSACEAHRSWIEAQVALGRNAVSIYQDLVERHGFRHAYNSVKPFRRDTQLRPPPVTTR